MLKNHFVNDAVDVFADAIRETTVPFGQPPPDGAIECLREARIRFPILEGVRFTLASCLFVRSNWAHSDDDYEEAMSIADEMITDPNEDVELAMHLARTLAHIRFVRYSRPEHLAEAIFRTRTLLDIMPSEHPNHCSVVKGLADLEKTRFEESGVRTDNVDDSHPAASPQLAKSNLVEFPLPMPDRRNSVPHIEALTSMLQITDLTNIEKAIESCRLCLTSPSSHLPLTLVVLGHLLHRLFRLTENINYLHESITVYRDLINMEGVPINLHTIARQLVDRLSSRFKLFKDKRDSYEIMELFAIAAADASTEVSRRFRTACEWPQVAQDSRHPSTLNAYETAISLMQETVFFAPTLEIQHFHLVAMCDQYEKLPLDYASYLIQVGQLKQAIEMLERGRGLLWSEMRGLHA